MGKFVKTWWVRKKREMYIPEHDYMNINPIVSELEFLKQYCPTFGRSSCSRSFCSVFSIMRYPNDCRNTNSNACQIGGFDEITSEITEKLIAAKATAREL